MNPKLAQRRYRLSSLALAAALVAMAPSAWAQSAEGSIFGTARATSSVTITNVETGFSRDVKAAADGSFSLSKLPPGRYRVSSGGVVREVSVAIGSGSQVNLLAADRVEVSGTRTLRSSIDVSTVESNTVFTQEQIQALPVPRSIESVALLAPGVVKGDPGLGSGTLPSFGGASVAENGYYINGFDVTNIRNFLAYATLPFDAIAQQQIKTGGYGAEYGRSLGGVISLVTKRGTNEWKGGGALYWTPSALREAGPDVADKEPSRAGLPYLFQSANTANSLSYNVYAGGPVVKDRLFIFALLDGRNNTSDTYGQSNSSQFRSTKPNGMVKIDFTPNDQHLFEFTGIDNKTRTQITDWTSAKNYSTSHDGAPRFSEQTSGGNVMIGKYTGYLTSNLTVSALVGRVNDFLPATTGARVQGQDCPVVLSTNLSEVGCWIGPFPGGGARDPNAPPDKDTRKAYRLDLEYNLGSKHTLRAGLDSQGFSSAYAGGSSYTGGHYYRYYTPTLSINGVVQSTPTPYVRDRIVQSTSGSYEVQNQAVYIEDTFKATKNLVLYGGLRSESFDNKNGDGISFVKANNLLAPRTGFSLDVNGDASLKIYGNAGRYFIPVASNTNIRATRGEIFTHTFYTYTSIDPRTQAPIGLKQIGPTINVGGDGALPDPRTIADTKLSPMNQDEFILGLQKAVAPGWVGGLKGTYRKINAGMDDFCGHYPMVNWAKDNGYTKFDPNSLAGCILMNPGRDVSLAMDLQNNGTYTVANIPARYFGLESYTRIYQALEFQLGKPFDGKWGAQFSYVLSRSYGTAEGYVQSQLNQEDAGITQDFDFGSFTHGSKGYLPNDRRHVFKLFGNYAVNQEWRLGLNAILSSGRPYSCIGFVPKTVADYAESGQYTSASSYYCATSTTTQTLVPRGSAGRTAWTNQLDLQVAYIPKWVGKGNKLTLQMDVFNVFNSQKPIELNEVRDYSRQTSITAPFQQSLNYLNPTGFQTPRSVRLAGRYEF
ncbi:MAG: TonB-dependent receptor plug domain-containing protein [Burkholderiales bacterium]|nr:TonB-dependent receptor plug domain-containing protein [Burkholderiales bacterium]